MNDFPFLTGISNQAGLQLVEYTPVASVSSFPSIANGVISSALTFAAGARWYSVYGSMSKKGYDEGGKETEHGFLYSPEIQLFYPGDTIATRQLLKLMEAPFHRYLLRLTDHNGFKRLVGTPWQGLTFGYEFTTDDNMGGARGYRLTWAGSLTEKPAVYTAST